MTISTSLASRMWRLEPSFHGYWTDRDEMEIFRECGADQRTLIEQVKYLFYSDLVSSSATIPFSIYSTYRSFIWKSHSSKTFRVNCQALAPKPYSQNPKTLFPKPRSKLVPRGLGLTLNCCRPQVIYKEYLNHPLLGLTFSTPGLVWIVFQNFDRQFHN